MDQVFIKAGDIVRVKENVTAELSRLEFDDPDAMDRFIDTEQTALAVWCDIDNEAFGEWYVTVDLCCEIPIKACELVFKPALTARAKEAGLVWRKHSALDMWTLESEKYFSYPNGSKTRKYGVTVKDDLWGDHPEKGTGYHSSVCINPRSRKHAIREFGSTPMLEEAMAIIETSFTDGIYVF